MAELRRRSTGDGVLDTRAAYRLSYLAQIDKRGPGVLTEGLCWPELLRRVDVGEVRAELAEESKEGVSGLLGSSVRLQECL